MSPQHYGAERRESGTAKAERLIREELKKLRWTDADLAARRKGAPEKARIAWRLRRETVMTLAWIAERLHMGAWTHVSGAPITAVFPLTAPQPCRNLQPGHDGGDKRRLLLAVNSATCFSKSMTRCSNVDSMGLFHFN